MTSLCLIPVVAYGGALQTFESHKAMRIMLVNNWICVAAHAEPMEEAALREMHPLQALLRTLLPWVNAGQVPDYAAETDAALEGERRD